MKDGRSKHVEYGDEALRCGMVRAIMQTRWKDIQSMPLYRNEAVRTVPRDDERLLVL